MNYRTDDTTLTLADLTSWSFNGTALAVLGHPIKHSVSPAMHNAALASLAGSSRDEFRSWKYFRFDVPPARLQQALVELHRAGFHGLNLTVPHKVLAFDQLQEADTNTGEIGAANTLVRGSNGWRGCNTDGQGLSSALRAELGVELRGAPVILLGAGGAARAAAVECLRQGCATLWIGNRTRANLETLLTVLSPVASEISRHGFDPAQPPAGLPAGAVLINATSAGLRPDDPAPIDLQRLPAGLKVFDMIYNPPQTALLKQAVALGLPAANGLSMLVHQGARSLEIWTGQSAPVSVMMDAARAALATS